MEDVYDITADATADAKVIFGQQVKAMARAADQTVRLDAWRSVFEKTNRIISGRPVTIRIVPENHIPSGMENTPGWSDGLVVHFNGPMVAELVASKDKMGAVLALKGLNYHELCHILYTPRMSDELPRRVVQRAKDNNDPTWWYAMNALEDQRIETWFTASYGAARRYFEAAVLQWLVKYGNAEAAILIYGRKYLPAKLRVKAGRVFVKKHGQPLYDEFKRVIDAYLGVALPTETVKALRLVTEYHDLLQRLQKSAPLPSLPVEDNGCSGSRGMPDKGDSDVIRQGRVLVRESKDARDAAVREVGRANKADADYEAQQEQDGQGGQGEQGEQDPQQGQDKPAPGAEGDGPDGPNAAGPGTGDGLQPGEPGTGTPGSGDPGDQPGCIGGVYVPGQDGQDGDSLGGIPGSGGGAGTDSIEHHVEAPEERALIEAMGDLLDEARGGLDEIQNDPTIQSDVGKVLDAVKAVQQNGEYGAKGSLARRNTTVSAEPADNLAVRKVHQVLKQIRIDTEPQTERRQVRGRIDARRLLTRRPNEVDVFTQWDEGSEDLTGVEAVVLLDVSGSMGPSARQASASVWALKRAFDKLEIRATVLTYDTSHAVMWQPGEKAKAQIPVINTGGGTDPTTALRQAMLVLRKSHEPNKVLVSVTDGQWAGDDRDQAAMMRNMHQVGVVSMLLGLDGALRSYGRHHHMEGHDLQSVSELPKAVLKLVTRIMRGASQRA